MNPKYKSILITAGVLLGIPLMVFLLIVFRDFLNIFFIVILFLTCLGLTSYGLYQVVYEELTERSNLHEQLYHGKSPEVRRWLDFFLDYFGAGELK